MAKQKLVGRTSKLVGQPPHQLHRKLRKCSICILLCGKFPGMVALVPQKWNRNNYKPFTSNTFVQRTTTGAVTSTGFLIFHSTSEPLWKPRNFIPIKTARSMSTHITVSQEIHFSSVRHVPQFLDVPFPGQPRDSAAGTGCCAASHCFVRPLIWRPSSNDGGERARDSCLISSVGAGESRQQRRQGETGEIERRGRRDVERQGRGDGETKQWDGRARQGRRDRRDRRTRQGW